MKKFGLLIPVLGMLSACSSYNPDIEVAAKQRAENRQEIRADIGCQFADTHSAYRNCLIATYNSQKPKTFVAETATDGKPVAVVSAGASLPTNQAIVNTAIVNTGGTLQTSVTDAATVQPNLPTTGVIALNADGTLACPTAPGEPCTYQQTGEVYEMQVPATPCGQANCHPTLIEDGKTVTVTTTETVTEKPVEVVPMPEPLPEKTWWETYQEEKTEEAPKIVCPCPDPNDPCPQCNSK